MIWERLVRPLIFRLDAERAHDLSIAALAHGPAPARPRARDPRLAVTLAGIDFANPLGMAAGYDKGARVPGALMRLGFGHVEVGTVTPRPQPGNPRPRLFRLAPDRAVINRFGFNSEGHDTVAARLAGTPSWPGVLGVNVGANKESTDRVADYAAGVARFGAMAGVGYLTVNVSSPNTPGLRDLQEGGALAELLAAVREAARPGLPIFLKVAPDLDAPGMEGLARALEKAPADALIVSNTTVSRHGASGPHASQTGGLSGRPLFARATIVLARLAERLEGRVPLVGVGGVEDADTAFAKIEAGAQLVQLYSAMVYGGPGLPGRILAGLSRRLDEEGLASLDAVRGRAQADWAGRALPG